MRVSRSMFQLVCNTSLDAVTPVTASLVRGVDNGFMSVFRRRMSADRSQLIRRAVQFSFFALNLLGGHSVLLLCAPFRGRRLPRMARPAGVEGWLPIAGLMNTKYFS